MNENLSPAFAAMVAMLTMPRQYSEVLAVAVHNCNSKCPSKFNHIHK